MESKEIKIETLLGVIDPKLIVSEKNGIIYIGGERADASRLANLKSEAEFLLQSDIWKILNASVQYETQRVMFSGMITKSKDKLPEDLLKGGAILYMLSIQNSILGTFKSVVHK